jgi:hypothetical protein
MLIKALLVVVVHSDPGALGILSICCFVRKSTVNLAWPGFANIQAYIWAIAPYIIVKINDMP